MSSSYKNCKWTENIAREFIKEVIIDEMDPLPVDSSSDSTSSTASATAAVTYCVCCGVIKATPCSQSIDIIHLWDKTRHEASTQIYCLACFTKLNDGIRLICESCYHFGSTCVNCGHLAEECYMCSFTANANESAILRYYDPIITKKSSINIRHFGRPLRRRAEYDEDMKSEMQYCWPCS